MLRVARCLPIYKRPLSTLGNNEMSYSEERLIGFSQQQMYSVVANVAEYHEFVPWCRKSNVLNESRHSMEAELEIGFPPLLESYTSRVTFVPPAVVHSVCLDNRLFRKLETTFRFEKDEKTENITCILHYELIFEFEKPLHRRIAHLFFDQVVKTMVSAFLKKAEQKYGKPTIPHGPGKILAYKS